MKQFVTVGNKTKPNKTNFNDIHNSEITEDFCSVAVSVTSGLPNIGSYKLIFLYATLLYWYVYQHTDIIHKGIYIWDMYIYICTYIYVYGIVGYVIPQALFS